MNRYDYREHMLVVSADLIREDDEILREEKIDGYAIYDSQSGTTDDKWIAFGRDHAQIERIVALLNS